MTALPAASGRGPLEVIAEAVARCADLVQDSAVHAGQRSGWVSWELDGSGVPTTARGGDGSLYIGDAGAAWACGVLARSTGRRELAELAARATATARARAHRDASLLAGAAGTALAGGAWPGEEPTGPPSDLPCSDLGGGLAGVLLAQVRCGLPVPVIRATASALVQRAVAVDGGLCWTDPAPAGEPSRPLCGLAHGASGIAVALGEAAATTGNAAAARAAGAAVRWERVWFDPLHGWPDLRGQAASYPAVWCHGAAGIGVARLRLAELEAAGIDLDLPAGLLRAEAEAAVGFTVDALERTCAEALRHGAGAVPAGLSLCHGSGGALDLLTGAARAWDDVALLERARGLAAELVDVLGEDPATWPSGTAAPGGAGLFLGVSGAGAVLARLLDPELPAPSLLPGAAVL